MNLRIHRLAVAEIDREVDYYESRQVGLVAYRNRTRSGLAVVITLPLQRHPDVGQRGHEGHRFTRAGVEAERNIERPRFLRDRVNHDAANADRVSGLRHTACAVAKQRAAQATALMRLIDSEAGQDGDRNWVRHIAAEPPGNAFHGHRSRSQGVVADDRVPFAHHEGPGRPARLIGARATPQPVIERRLARTEIIDLVMSRQRRRRRQRPAHSQGAGVCRLLRKRLLGRGGASSRARNSRYAFALKANTVRSVSASSAA